MRYTNSIMLFTRIATVWYAAIVILNLVVPVLNGTFLNFNLFSVIILIIWTVAILSAHGIIKRLVSTLDDKIVYDTVLPIFLPTLVRLGELAWMYFRHKQSFNKTVFLIEIAADIVFIIILLLDKSRYYYEAEEVIESEEFK